MQEDKNYCVYLHRNKKTNEVFYVGSGRPKRAQEKKLKEAQTGKQLQTLMVLCLK